METKNRLRRLCGPTSPATGPNHDTARSVTGLVLDIQMRTGWTRIGPYSNAAPMAPLIVGVGRTRLTHPIGPASTVRLYLINDSGRSLAIQIDDLHRNAHLTAYAAVRRRTAVRHRLVTNPTTSRTR